MLWWKFTNAVWNGSMSVYYVQSSRCRIKDNERWSGLDSIGCWLQSCCVEKNTCHHAILDWYAFSKQIIGNRAAVGWFMGLTGETVLRFHTGAQLWRNIFSVFAHLDKVTLNSNSVFMLLCIHNCASVNTLGTKTWQEREGHGCLDLGSRTQRWRKATSTQRMLAVPLKLCRKQSQVPEEILKLKGDNGWCGKE